MRRAREILKRIKRRDIYKCAVEVILNKEMSTQRKEMTEERIAEYGESLKAEDILVSSYYLNYGSKDRNPVEKVNFYNSSSPCTSSHNLAPFHINIKQTSLILPEMFQELYVRVFAKHEDKVLALS